MPKQIKEKRIEQSEPSCWSKFQKGKKMNFHVEPISGMNFHVRPDLQNEKKWKKNEKNEKKWTFSFFHFFFILKVHFFSGPQKKFILKLCPRQKFIFFSFRKNVRSKSLFFVYLLVSKFQVQIPYPKPALNPKSLGFRV